jgi:hypothetical protein
MSILGTRVVWTEDPRLLTAGGTCTDGLRLAGTIGATPAALSAVVDAVAHLGVRHIGMPATPLRVWTAISEARAREGA